MPLPPRVARGPSIPLPPRSPSGSSTLVPPIVVRGPVPAWPKSMLDSPVGDRPYQLGVAIDSLVKLRRAAELTPTEHTYADACRVAIEHFLGDPNNIKKLSEAYDDPAEICGHIAVLVGEAKLARKYVPQLLESRR